MRYRNSSYTVYQSRKKGTDTYYSPPYYNLRDPQTHSCTTPTGGVLAFQYMTPTCKNVTHILRVPQYLLAELRYEPGSCSLRHTTENVLKCFAMEHENPGNPSLFEVVFVRLVTNEHDPGVVQDC